MFMGYDPDILAAERVAVTRGKIPERHPKGATDFCVHLIRGARKAIGRAAATNNSPVRVLFRTVPPRHIRQGGR